MCVHYVLYYKQQLNCRFDHFYHFIKYIIYTLKLDWFSRLSSFYKTELRIQSTIGDDTTEKAFTQIGRIGARVRIDVPRSDEG